MVQSQADSAAPSIASGDACLTWPGRYCWTVTAGTVPHALGTVWSSPGWNVVISPPGTTGAGADLPGTTTAAVTPPARTTRPAAMISQRRRRRAAARRAWPRAEGRRVRPGPLRELLLLVRPGGTGRRLPSSGTGRACRTDRGQVGPRRRVLLP